MWFTETPWPPILILAVIAAGFGAAFISTQRARLILPILVLAVLAIGIYVIEEQIVTERERVETSIHEVAAAFERQDMNGTLAYFSEQALLLRAIAANAVLGVQVQDDLRITDVSVELSNSESRAKSHFRANGSFSVMGFGDVGHQPTRWNVDWQKEGGEWRIVNVQRLDPINGEPFADIFESSQRAQ